MTYDEVMTIVDIAVLAYKNADVREDEELTTMEEVLEDFGEFVKHPDRW